MWPHICWVGGGEWSRCLLMTGSTKRASYKTHMIHKQHPAATLMSNGVSAFISGICIMNSGIFLVHAVHVVSKDNVK